MDIIILLIGLFLVFLSAKTLKNRINQSGIKTILPLPAWSVVCLMAGVFLGYRSIHLSLWNFLLIVGLLILTIPLQAWIDAKYICKDNIWGVKDFIFACSYEIGLIITGISLVRLILIFIK